MRPGCDSLSHAELWLVRHGEVAREWAGRLYGGLDVPLSPHGEAQSRAIARRLAQVGLTQVASSGLARADYAARRMAEPLGLPHRIDPRLVEIARGEWAGRTWEELAALDPERVARMRALGGALGAPGGEELADVRARVLPALDALAAGGGRVAVVAHRWVLAVAAAEALEVALDACGGLELPHCGGVRLAWPTAGRGPLGGGAASGGGGEPVRPRFLAWCPPPSVEELAEAERT